MSHLVPLPAPVVLAGDAVIEPLPVSLHDAVAAVRRRHRHLIAAAGQWALGQGVSLPADHVALWAAAVEELGHPLDFAGPAARWRASHIPELSGSMARWCSVAGCSPPADLGESLWHLLGFLLATGRLDPRSDSLHELRAAAVVFGGFDHFRALSLPPSTAA